MTAEKEIIISLLYQGNAVRKYIFQMYKTMGKKQRKISFSLVSHSDVQESMYFLMPN